MVIFKSTQFRRIIIFALVAILATPKTQTNGEMLSIDTREMERRRDNFGIPGGLSFDPKFWPTRGRRGSTPEKLEGYGTDTPAYTCWFPCLSTDWRNASGEDCSTIAKTNFEKVYKSVFKNSIPVEWAMTKKFFCTSVCALAKD